ncbi:MAG: branched-chain amino acid ABC transporter permease [Nitrospiraceae bacterium]|nr:MAG: branched-chain amino acid ABC transporter permease [Nitrospiraceae bacterium]
MDRSKYIPVLVLTAVVISVQAITAAMGKGFYLTQLTMSAYYSLLIVGLCLLMGYAGQISLGHAGFFAIGGYISAFLTTFDLTPYQTGRLVSFRADTGLLQARQDLYGGHLLTLHPWSACLLAVLVAVTIASVIGGPVLKLKGHYLAMAPLGFGIIVYAIVLATPLFGEADGLSDVPPFELLPGLSISGKLSLRVQNYYIAWVLVIATIILLQNLVHSRVGRALRSIHGAEDAANAMGVDTAQYKLKTFVLSAAFAAIAGVCLTHYNGGIGPSEASIMKSVRYVAIVAIGGMANLWGALVMGSLLNFFSLRGYFGSFDDAVFGTILIVIMLFSPEGLLRMEIVRALSGLFRRGSAEEEAS